VGCVACANPRHNFFCSPLRDSLHDQAMLDEVAAEIKAVSVKLEQVEADIKQAQAEHNAEEVAALRKNLERLGKREEQLRAEKLLLIQRQPGASFLFGCSGRRVGL